MDPETQAIYCIINIPYSGRVVSQNLNEDATDESFDLADESRLLVSGRISTLEDFGWEGQIIS